MTYKVFDSKKTALGILGIGFLGLISLALFSALEAKNYGAAGCGPGSLVFRENTKPSQVMAVTTKWHIFPNVH